ncbi:zinc-binding protein A33-like [Latimeria chalumnae]|uniref:zinc-binding protein A33-like n=1 Tax=Latimeria chalumnae TaxID=7897 RepID=UPI0003C12325
MDSRSSTGGLEDEMTCSVCQELFKDPVTLRCGHNFCQECVCEYWKGKTTPACPICRAGSTTSDLITNHTLRNIVDSYKKEVKKPKGQSKSVCSQHEEVLKLYCLEDQEAICLVCEKSRKHEHHKCLPVEEAAQEFKEEVKTALTPLQDTEKKLTKVKKEYDKHLKHILDQAEKTEKQIKEDFVKLHQFLHEEEKNLLADLKKEKEEKEQKMREKIKSISEEIASLSNSIKDIEKKMDQEDNLFLMNLQGVKKRAASIYKEPDVLSGALIDVAKYLGNLQYRVWKKMRTVINAVTVTLDPNTASPWVTLSEDLTSVTYGSTRKNLPDNLERFDTHVLVLGSEGFTSGRHSWVVDVGNKTKWDLGVVKESINRKGTVNLKTEHGYWAIVLRDGKKYSACTNEWTEIKLKTKPKKIWVSLHYEAGGVSFYNADDMSHIYTFTQKFTEKLYPYFDPCNNDNGLNSEPLRICPLKLTVEEMI